MLKYSDGLVFGTLPKFYFVTSRIKVEVTALEVLSLSLVTLFNGFAPYIYLE